MQSVRKCHETFLILTELDFELQTRLKLSDLHFPLKPQPADYFWGTFLNKLFVEFEIANDRIPKVPKSATNFDVCQFESPCLSKNCLFAFFHRGFHQQRSTHGEKLE